MFWFENFKKRIGYHWSIHDLFSCDLITLIRIQLERSTITCELFHCSCFNLDTIWLFWVLSGINFYCVENLCFYLGLLVCFINILKTYFCLYYFHMAWLSEFRSSIVGKKKILGLCSLKNSYLWLVWASFFRKNMF